MKIQIYSDLHLEFATNRNWLKHNPLISKAEILLIAGDTYYLERDFSKLEFIKRLSKDFKSVYLIPGNHEYYGGFDISTALYPTKKQIEENVFLLNNHSILIEDVRFIFSTMWSNIQQHIVQVMHGMVDFRRIKFKGKIFTINHFNKIHKVALEFLSAEVKKPGTKVVVTHHLPSSLCNAQEFKGSVLNEAFCAEQTNFILNHEIDFWIYGHSHRNLTNFKIGNTNMVTNQLGYVEWNEHQHFNYQKVIEIPKRNKKI